MRALITGGRGFVGPLARRAPPRPGRRGGGHRPGDRRGRPGGPGPGRPGRRPDAIYHLAALTHVGESWDDPAEVLRVNVLGTAGVLAAARALPAPPVVLVVSSAEVYGIVRPDELPLTEDVVRGAGHPLRGQQGRGRAGGPAGLARLRPDGARGPAVQPRRSGPGRQLRRLGAWPGGSSRPGGTGAETPAGGHAQCDGGTSPTSATWSGPTACWSSGARRARSTTSARATTWPSPRSPTG